MEFIEGDTLGERIKAGPLKLVEAVRLASEIADGLKAAHSKEIVHRDIKAANIMLDADGRAKILDFGLAQTAQSTKLTRMGSTLGTVAYMSPEQARGEEVDNRTDLWALGVVLYEMVTGKNPFGGDYEQAVVYSILNETPEPLTAVRTGVPMGLEWIVTKTMAKNAADRYQTATDLMVDLKNVDTSSLAMSRSMASVSGMPSAAQVPESTSTKTTSQKSRILVVLAGLLAMAIAWYGRTLSSSSEEKPFRIIPIHIEGISRIADLEMSPDGNLIAFTGVDTSGRAGIYLHDRSTGKTRFLEGSSNQEYPHFSPDGSRLVSSSIGFNGVWVTAMPSGLPFEWAPAGGASGWEDDATIIVEFAGDIYRLHGPEAPLELAVRTDSLPGTEQFIFTGDVLLEERSLLASFQYSSNENARLITVDLEAGTYEILEEAAINAWYVKDGFVVYQVGTDIGPMVVRPFDKKNLAWTGPAVPLLPETNWYHLRPTPDGDLLYVPPTTTAITKSLEWLEYDGSRSIVKVLGDTFWFDPSISPDGQTVLLSMSEVEALWDVPLIAINLADKTESVISEMNGRSSGTWMPDGIDILRTATPTRGTAIVKQRFGSLNITEIVEENATDPNISRSGKWLVFTRNSNVVEFSIEARNVETGDTHVVASFEELESDPSISPNDLWVAYSVRTAETIELRVAPLDGSDSFTIERNVELGSAWSSDGQYLYFIRAGNLFRLRVDSGSAFSKIGAAEALTTDGLVRGFSLDPTSDGILLLTDDRPPPDYVVIEWWQNWAAELKRTIPSN